MSNLIRCGRNKGFGILATVLVIFIFLSILTGAAFVLTNSTQRVQISRSDSLIKDEKDYLVKSLAITVAEQFVKGDSMGVGDTENISNSMAIPTASGGSVVGRVKVQRVASRYMVTAQLSDTSDFKKITASATVLVKKGDPELQWTEQN